MEDLKKQWKPGQLVTLNKKVYRIKKANTTNKFGTCCLCASINDRPPCIEAFDYPSQEVNMDYYKCVRKLKYNQYPKQWKEKSRA